MNLYELDELLNSLRSGAGCLGRDEDLIKFYEKMREELLLKIKKKLDRKLGIGINTKTIDMVK